MPISWCWQLPFLFKKGISHVSLQYLPANQQEMGHEIPVSSSGVSGLRLGDDNSQERQTLQPSWIISPICLLMWFSNGCSVNEAS